MAKPNIKNELDRLAKLRKQSVAAALDGASEEPQAAPAFSKWLELKKIVGLKFNAAEASYNETNTAADLVEAGAYRKVWELILEFERKEARLAQAAQ